MNPDLSPWLLLLLPINPSSACLVDPLYRSSVRPSRSWYRQCLRQDTMQSWKCLCPFQVPPGWQPIPTAQTDWLKQPSGPQKQGTLFISFCCCSLLAHLLPWGSPVCRAVTGLCSFSSRGQCISLPFLTSRNFWSHWSCDLLSCWRPCITG